MHDTATLQLIAYSSLTLTGIIVSATSLLIAYRQNFGWKPVVIYVGRREEPFFKTKVSTLYVTFEVWNRQKYPILLRSAKISFAKGSLLFGEVAFRYDGEWSALEGDHVEWDGAVRLDAGAHQAIEAYAPLNSSLHPKNPDLLLIQVRYFDPIKNKHIDVTIPAQYAD